MRYRAAAVLPHDDPHRAEECLRDQLRMMATAGKAVPRWQSLAVDGPTTVAGADGRAWFEWTACVDVDGERLAAPPDDAVLADRLARTSASTATAPHQAV